MTTYPRSDPVGPAHAANRSTHTARTAGRLAAVGLLAAAVALLASTGVYAGLAASSTAGGSVASGTLDLRLSPDVGTGFSAFTGPMAPGDTHNVFVDLANTGTLASKPGMRLAVSGFPSNALTNGAIAGRGLTVTVSRCSVPWVLATGACRGTLTTMLTTRRISAVPVGGAALAGVPALVATRGRVAHVRVRVGFVATERSRNGVAPVRTVQNLATTLHFGFVEQQRNGIRTNH